MLFLERMLSPGFERPSPKADQSKKTRHSLVKFKLWRVFGDIATMNRKLATLLVVAGLALTLTSCAASTEHTPVPFPEPKLPATPSSTLDGGIVAGNGVTIQEFSEDVAMDELDEGGLIRYSESSFLLEAGGSSSAACLSNFTAIERNGDEFTLTHRIGNGDGDMVCTMDYRFTYFLVEAEEPIGDDAVVTIVSRGEVARTLTFETPVE